MSESAEVYEDQESIGVARLKAFGARKPIIGATTKFVRNWALCELVPDAILRMAEIGMGREKFQVPTMAGNIVNIPAPAAVQRAALHDLIAIGLPAQIGLVDDQGDALPGVIALGQYDMQQVQAHVHAAHQEPPPDALPPKATGGYELPPEHELVTVDEGIGTTAATSEDRPPGPMDDTPTPEQAILARHRARMRTAKHIPLPTQPNPIIRSLTDSAD